MWDGVYLLGNVFREISHWAHNRAEKTWSLGQVQNRLTRDPQIRKKPAVKVFSLPRLEKYPNWNYVRWQYHWNIIKSLWTNSNRWSITDCSFPPTPHLKEHLVKSFQHFPPATTVNISVYILWVEHVHTRGVWWDQSVYSVSELLFPQIDHGTFPMFVNCFTSGDLVSAEYFIAKMYHT